MFYLFMCLEKPKERKLIYLEIYLPLMKEKKVNHRRKDEDFFIFYFFLNDEFFVYLTIK